MTISSLRQNYNYNLKFDKESTETFVTLYERTDLFVNSKRLPHGSSLLSIL